MPDARGRPGTSLDRPNPKKPTPKPKKPDAEMTEATAFDSPPKNDKGRGLRQVYRKKKRAGRGMRQVQRELTPKEWATIARSMNDRRRPYAPRPRFGGFRSGYRRR